MDASVGLTHFTSAAIVVYGMNKLKAAKWFPLLQKDWTWLNRCASIFLAGLVSIGIGYTWASSAEGTHTLTLTIPNLAVLAVGIWHWLNQYALQETLHQLTKEKQATSGPNSIT